MDYYSEIKNKLLDNEMYSKIKDYSKNRNDLQNYYFVGKLLNEAGKHYGDSIVKKYSDKLTIELGKKYSVRVLYKMIKYYNFVKNGKVPTVSAQLTWSHYDELLKFDDYDKINYYIIISIQQNLSIRKLRDKIKYEEYERLSDETKNKIIYKKDDNCIKDFIKNPIIIKNKYNYENISEKVLQKLILEDISTFMKELGNKFCFIESEYKIKLDDIYNYIDLLLYNIEFNCYVVVELKVTELKKEYIGQIEVYMNYIDRNVKSINQNKTIGIIICKRDNKFIMEYCSDDRILSREYELVY